MTSSANYTHLGKAALAVIEGTSAERLAWLQNQTEWIPYPLAVDVLKDIDQLIKRPRHPRMRGRLIISDSNNGKSRLAKEIAARYPIDPNEDGEHIIMPVLLLELPPRPDENDVLDELLKMLHQPFRRKAPVSEKRQQLIVVLQKCGLRALLVDEMQRLLGSGQEKRRVVMDALRYLANQIPVPLVIFSTPRGANAISSSDEMINRLQSRIIPAWQLDDDFRRLLASHESIIPLRERSRLTTKAMAALIHSKTEGLIGEVHDLLEDAATLAFDRGVEKIDEPLIRALAWTEPSKRKKLIGAHGRTG